MPLIATNLYIFFNVVLCSNYIYRFPHSHFPTFSLIQNFIPTFFYIITFARKNMYSDGVKSEQHGREVLSPLLKLLFALYVFLSKVL